MNAFELIFIYIHVSFYDNYEHKFVLVCSVSELATRPATFLKQFGHFQFGLFSGLKILKDLVEGPNMHRKKMIFAILWSLSEK